MGLYLSRELICMSEPAVPAAIYLPVPVPEEITSVNISLSLTTLVEQLHKDTTQHDYLVALLLVLLVESGFCIMYDLDTEDQCFVLQKPCRNKYSLKIMQTKAVDGSSKLDDSSNYKNVKFIHIPKNWKSETDEYKIYFALPKFKNIPLKLITVPMNDKGFFNISTWIGKKSICNMEICIANYVCPCPHILCKCSDNLEIIYILKKGLITPTQVYVLASLGLANPSLQGLPTELQHKVIGMLDTKDVIRLAQCSRKFLQLCSEEWVWKNMLARYYPTRYMYQHTIRYNLCYQFLTFRTKLQGFRGLTESNLLKWFTSTQKSKNIWYPIKARKFRRPRPELSLRNRFEMRSWSSPYIQESCCYMAFGPQQQERVASYY